MRKRERDWAIKNLSQFMFRWKARLKKDVVIIQEVLNILVQDDNIQMGRTRNKRLRKHYGRMRKATRNGL